MAQSRGVGENSLPKGPSALLVYSKQPPLRTPANSFPEHTEPAFSGGLQHRPPADASPHLHVAQCLPCVQALSGEWVSKCLESHGRSSEVRGDPWEGIQRPWRRAISVAMCDLGDHLTVEAQSSNHLLTWVTIVHPSPSLGCGRVMTSNNYWAHTTYQALE